MLRLASTHRISILRRSLSSAITRIGTDDPRMSQIVKHGDTVYLSGQVAQDFDASFHEQVHSTLSKVDDLLHMAGTNKSHLLSAQLWLRNMSDFHEMNVIWNEWIDHKNKPVRACVEAPMARDNILFEVMVIAAVPSAEL
jgi:enamine deaminase RidA (YjgF/YER057c/UK114 family)